MRRREFAFGGVTGSALREVERTNLLMRMHQDYAQPDRALQHYATRQAMTGISDAVEHLHRAAISAIPEYMRQIDGAVLEMRRNASLYAEAVRPIGETFNRAAINLQPFAEHITRQFDAVRQFTSQMDAFRAPLHEYANVFAKMAHRENLAQACVRIGIFPVTAVIEHVENLEIDDSGSRSLTKEIVNEMWPAIKAEIQDQIAEFDLPEQSRKLISQALIAYEHECYEIIPAGVFAGVERPARSLMFQCGGNEKNAVYWLRDRIGEMSPYEIGGIEYLEMYKHLCDGAYRNVWSDEDVDGSEFPNRHELIHGYNRGVSQVKALNSILFANFILCAIASLEKALDSKPI